MERTNAQDAPYSREARLQRLLLQALGGDAAAYREFLCELGGHLRGFLRRRLAQRPEEAEDLLQEVLLAVHNARHSYRADQPLTAWVQAIARYKLADHFRRHGRHEALNQVFDEETTLLEEHDDEPAQAKRDLAKLLALLPERQRLPIEHVKLQGLTVEESAQLTGLSASAVKIGVHRGLKALARLIRGKP